MYFGSFMSIWVEWIKPKMSALKEWVLESTGYWKAWEFSIRDLDALGISEAYFVLLFENVLID